MNLGLADIPFVAKEKWKNRGSVKLSCWILAAL